MLIKYNGDKQINYRGSEHVEYQHAGSYDNNTCKQVTETFFLHSRMQQNKRMKGSLMVNMQLGVN